MTFTQSNTANDVLQALQSLDTDQQLALFWYLYKEMGDSITPAAPGASTVSPEIAEGLLNQVLELSHEEQLQLQRDLIERKNSLIAREYGALGDTTKLLFWYRLAQEMDTNRVIPFPANYQLSEQAQPVFEQIKQLDFGQQITVFRDYVSPMGVDPNTAEHDSETGL
ncbi:MAG: orange carotenoid protein N-terminal domain-containing protein [Leptolyngbyaceae cyanobacterium bins.302]|nr:orange carotenoid protein N-terminal domain-containing protein [Leptolyngbyaceae cyanobacterium bins.302]